MMGRGPFERFKVTILLLLFSSCATANTPVGGKSEIQVKPAPVNFRAELSSHEVVAGTIALLTTYLPAESSGGFRGEFEGIELPFFPQPSLGEGFFAAVLSVPYERKPGPGVVTVHLSQSGKTEIGETHFELPLNVKDGHYASEVLHVDGRRVNPTRKKDLLRIQKEQAEVLAIYKRVTPKKYWEGPFILPIQSKVTSQFGTKRVYNGQLKNFHPGLDLKAPMKTPVHSAAPGEVVLSKNLFYTGNTVMIDHGYGVITLYAHMSQLKVKLGQVVKTGQLLGLSGKTGRVNGPHLHWQAVVDRVKINPLGLTQVMR